MLVNVFSSPGVSLCRIRATEAAGVTHLLPRPVSRALSAAVAVATLPDRW